MEIENRRPVYKKNHSKYKGASQMKLAPSILSADFANLEKISV